MIQKFNKLPIILFYIIFFIVIVAMATFSIFPFVASADDIVTSVFFDNVQDLYTSIYISPYLYNSGQAEMFYTDPFYYFDNETEIAFYSIDKLWLNDVSGSLTIIFYALDADNIGFFDIDISNCSDLDIIILLGTEFDMSNLTFYDYPFLIEINNSGNIDINFYSQYELNFNGGNEPIEPDVPLDYFDHFYDLSYFGFLNTLIYYITFQGHYTLIDIACLIYILSWIGKYFAWFYRRLTNDKLLL